MDHVAWNPVSNWNEKQAADPSQNNSKKAHYTEGRWGGEFWSIKRGGRVWSEQKYRQIQQAFLHASWLTGAHGTSRVSPQNTGSHRHLSGWQTSQAIRQIQENLIWKDWDHTEYAVQTQWDQTGELEKYPKHWETKENSYIIHWSEHLEGKEEYIVQGIRVCGTQLNRH